MEYIGVEDALFFIVSFFILGREVGEVFGRFGFFRCSLVGSLFRGGGRCGEGGYVCVYGKDTFGYIEYSDVGGMIGVSIGFYWL